MKKNNVQKVILKSGFVVAMCFILFDLYGQSDQAKSLPQFLFPEFSKGIIKMKDGRTLSAILDYNMVDEEMVFQQQGGVYMVVDKPEEIDTVYIKNRKFVYIPKAFYEVVVKGPVTIFIQQRSRYTPVGSATAYGMTSKTLGPTAVWSMQAGNQVRQITPPDNVTVSPAIAYWVKVNGQMNKFTNEKQFLKIFPESQKEIKDFIKSSGIDIKTREGLFALGNFCNGLK
ncbi:MAG: hypothetical protein ABSA76_06555 [Bacteroidales bacterium]